MSNTFGTLFRYTSFGESHGTAIGGVIDGCPSNVKLDMKLIQREVDRRRPGQSDLTTTRTEADTVEFLSGIFEGKTTGAPIAFIIRNTQQRSDDYEHLKDIFRPSHADFTYQQKYGWRDYRGGGRASARETAVRVVVGAVAKQILANKGIEIHAYTSQIGAIALDKTTAINFDAIENNEVRCPDATTAAKMADCIRTVKADGDSIGGIVSCKILNVPLGLGEPIYSKFESQLAMAMLSINAAKGFDYGSGFDNVALKGSEMNDAFVIKNGKIATATNYSGGIQGGISNGEEISFRVVFKATPTISKKQNTINSNGKQIELQAHGRHDPCVVPRAVPVVEAMAAIVTLDLLLLSQANQYG
ncbi:MAG TPA: chorismate synthase [Paludibacteraceae bacterium]|nr:chorismate synthase [Paludibacteraceae bacterium]